MISKNKISRIMGRHTISSFFDELNLLPPSATTGEKYSRILFNK